MNPLLARILDADRRGHRARHDSAHAQRVLGPAPDNTNHALALAFGVLIVFMVVAGSLWIMADLNAGHISPDMPMNMPMEH